MDITVGTLNLNNLFGRWNLYVKVPDERGLPGAEAAIAVGPPRDWLEDAPVAATRALEARNIELPDVRITLERDLIDGRIKWRANPADGRVVYRKSAEARRVLTRRIKALDADVLAGNVSRSCESGTEPRAPDEIAVERDALKPAHAKWRASGAGRASSRRKLPRLPRMHESIRP